MIINLNVDALVNKLRNTVSQVAYQVNSSVNTILPGNSTYRDYEILKFRCTYGCPGFVWQVYDSVKRDSSSIKASLKDAIGKTSTIPTTDSTSSLNELSSNSESRQLFSIFVFNKNQLDSLKKNDKEKCLEFMKKGVTQLTRLKHPSVLTVQQPLEESRSSLAFITEHVYGSLSSILALEENRCNDIGSPHNSCKATSLDLVDLSSNVGPKDSDYQDDSCQLDGIQIKAGLLQLCDGLKFLHNSAHLLHRNLCLENIFVDSYNTWKLAGFDFCCHPIKSVDLNTSQGDDRLNDLNDLLDLSNEKTSKSELKLDRFESLQATCKASLPQTIIPNWSCSAPEHSNSESVTELSDIYSLGVISCFLLINHDGKGKNSLPVTDLNYEFGSVSDPYRRGIKIREIVDKLNPTAKNQLLKFTSINSETRPSLNNFESLDIFQDNLIQAIRDLDAQFSWDKLKKIDSYNRLRDILPKLSHQVKINRVAKLLSNELIRIDMMPHVLPNILIIVKDSTPIEFKKKLFDKLKPAFRILEPRIVPTMILDSLFILLDRSVHCRREMQELAFNQIQYLLELDQPESMHDKCFSVLPEVKDFVDENSMKNIILPKLGQICINSSNLSLRLKSLDCICKLLEVVERWTFVEVLLPILTQIPTLNAELIISITTIIRTACDLQKNKPSKETIAKKVIPFLAPLCVEKDLKPHQFQIVMALIRKLLDKIEWDHKNPASINL